MLGGQQVKCKVDTEICNTVNLGQMLSMDGLAVSFVDSSSATCWCSQELISLQYQFCNKPSVFVKN